MNRLSGARPGATLPLRPDDLLMARAIHPLPNGGFVDVRMRVGVDSSAERSEHRIADGPSTFSHVTAPVEPSTMTHLQTLLAAALSDPALRTDPSDPQAVFRSLQVWEGTARVTLAVEYEAGQPTISAETFQEAWQILKRLFHNADRGSSVASDGP
jgi:hypothetical protein